ncbi:bifunctional precorrin-2 dehydrogenase/sirohydrochlorin ferrochelatase [Ferruginibacter paludis]|uniref:precorrin-2 dehydrogenase/sirohydrochlorin ferrochelatase family protein n=1 Tax=Ferruginibacter paludis TaxID=1310417 RepID=UPI0025B59EAB|nr:bifunctional precorrin-2 dehydrogenase/sirohydrochlorin ferrochelatase [Ferruginibacter paludis]MDN3654333.1 bifunctional precorrin-2 dehydrogenase/sirohydrochlorin ferrochelatase [Ferruginibacter paludis]
MVNNISPAQNELFPVFLKLKQLRLLIVGGGYVGMEKLQAVLANSPAAVITLVASEISGEIKELVKEYPGVTLAEKPYQLSDFDNIDIAIAAINDPVVSGQVAADAKLKGILINVADKPDLCDFYLGSVVQKGNLKVAISTNGKSPTIAKRVKEMLNETLPDELDSLLDNMQAIRNKMTGDFTDKVRQLNEITKNLSQNK